MGNISLEYFNKYRYSIRGALGTVYISEPVNWNDDEKVFKRSLDTHGVFINLSNNLEFYVGDENNDGGYDYLKETYNTTGINSVVSLVKEEDISGKWVEAYRGYFDFSTYVQFPYKITIMFNESGLYEKIKARQSEELEVDRLTTMDGDVIPEMKTEIVGLDGRKILIISQLNLTSYKEQVYIPLLESFGNLIISENESIISLDFSGAKEYGAAMIPMTMVAEQDGKTQTIWDYEGLINGATGVIVNASSTGTMFYDEAENPKTLRTSMDIEVAAGPGEQILKMAVKLIRYGGVDSLEPLQEVNLIYVENPVQGEKHTFKADNYDIPLLANESLALMLWINYNPTSIQVETCSVSVTKANITITDETYADPSQAKFIMPFECLDRIINIITGKSKRLISNALGKPENGYDDDGFAALTGLTNGFWVREFNTSMITTSFSDFMDSFSSVWQLGYGIEKIGFEENVRVEHISHFYKEVVTIKLVGNVNNIVRKCAKEYFYSSLNIGYSQPSGTVLYEEVLGLDEYNIQNTYTTPITRIDNRLQNISKYRADSYGTEFARRKPKARFPEEDTRYDLSVMVLDLKRGVSSIFQQRKWDDDFVVPVPFDNYSTGIYSPETATNLRFSPMNTLKRMGYWIKGGFMKNLTEYIRYSSSNGNSKLITLSNIPGSVETAENGNVLCSDLDKNLFNPEIITFAFAVDTKLMKTVNGTTVVNGETIMNYYGLVEFTNEYGDYEYGYLLSLEPNNEGKFELLSSTKRISSVSYVADNNLIITPPKDLNAIDITP